MQQARDVAADAGLTVTATEILPPGPAPGPAPVQPPSGSSPGSAEEYEQNMTGFSAAFSDHERKVAAYAEVSATVAACREREQEAHRGLRDALKNQILVNLKNYGPTAAGAAIGTTSAAYTAQKPLLDKLGQYSAGLDRATAAADTPGATFAQRAQATNEALVYRKAISDTTKSIGPQVPKPVGTLVAANPGTAAEQSVRFQKAAPALKKLPYVGTAVTVYSAGQGIAEGKPAAKEVEKAVVGTGGSIAAGAVAGTCIGGPVGAVVGAAAGAVFSYGAGKFIDWKGGPVEQLNREVGIE